MEEIFRLTVTQLYKSKYCTSVSLVLLGRLGVVGVDVFVGERLRLLAEEELQRPLHLDRWPSGLAARDDSELQQRLIEWMLSTCASGRHSGLTYPSSRWAF